jgi:hypothetical protein
MTLRVSIQQAACNSLAGYLEQILTDVVVEPRWPAPDKKKVPKAITIVTAGSRRDLPIPIRYLQPVSVPGANDDVTAIWQVAACTQPLQLDIWTESDVERDDIIARLDECLNAGESALTDVYNPDPVGHGVLLALGDGWTTSSADFYFEAPDLEDLSDSVGRASYRATYRGDANFMLALTKTTASQKLINFKIALSATDALETFSP